MTALTKEERKLWNTLKYDYDRGWKPRTNIDMMKAYNISMKVGYIIEPLAESIIWVAETYLNKKGYTYHTYRADIVAEAVLAMIRSVRVFNPNKSNNIFAYFAVVASSAALHVVHNENKQNSIKEEQLHLKQHEIYTNDSN
jgi:hypothetical protein